VPASGSSDDFLRSLLPGLTRAHGESGRSVGAVRRPLTSSACRGVARNACRSYAHRPSLPAALEVPDQSTSQTAGPATHPRPGEGKRTRMPRPARPLTSGFGARRRPPAPSLWRKFRHGRDLHRSEQSRYGGRRFSTWRQPGRRPVSEVGQQRPHAARAFQRRNVI
jgi:hypothetical protein